MALGRFVVLNKEVTAGPGRTPQACIWWGGRQCPHTLLLKCKKETCFSFLSLVDSSVLLRTPLCIIIIGNLPLGYCFCSVFHLEHCGSSVSWCTSVLRKGEHRYRGEGLERTPRRENTKKGDKLHELNVASFRQESNMLLAGEEIRRDDQVRGV